MSNIFFMVFRYELRNRYWVSRRLLLLNLNSRVTSTFHVTLSTLQPTLTVRVALISPTKRPCSTFFNEELASLLLIVCVLLVPNFKIFFALNFYFSLLRSIQRLNLVLNDVIKRLLASFLERLTKSRNWTWWLYWNFFFSRKCASILNSYSWLVRDIQRMWVLLKIHQVTSAACIQRGGFLFKLISNSYGLLGKY